MASAGAPQLALGVLGLTGDRGDAVRCAIANTSWEASMQINQSLSDARFTNLATYLHGSDLL